MNSEQEYIDALMLEYWRKVLDKGPPTYIDWLLIPASLLQKEQNHATHPSQ